MAVTITKLVRKSGRVAKKAAKGVETRVLAAVGRQAVKVGAKKSLTTAKAIGKRAAKKALTAAALAAAGAVYQEMRRKRKTSRA
jgi:hypothetical protein